MLTITIETLAANILASGVRLGEYQRDLLRGERRWSGADLQGKARQYSGRYKRSRDRVADLLEAEARRQGVSIAWVGGNAKEGPRRPVVA